MSYMALYRKFRPMSFEDVKGQNHIVRALKNQIKSGRIGHAYLFSGTRGTGKTTIAKIFAKAVNCEKPIDGSPCNECRICRGINEQTSLNVIEIDAASNNSVENIRRIVEEVQYSPTEGKYKVYIIDEVHMLSTGAFNALLKTLEEPPSYVIFILATTESHKLPVTILSRCQRYDFKRIQVDTIVERLKELTAAEHIDAEEDALYYIAKNADGAMRDALSLLDQCNAFYMGQILTYERVLDVLGAVDNDIFIKLFDFLIHDKVTKAVEMVDELIMEGKDISQFIINFTWFIRNVMLLKTTSADAGLVDMTKEMTDEIRKMSVDISLDGILRYIRVLSEASNQLRYSVQKRIVAEMTFIKLCRPQMEDDNQSVISRIENIENKLENGFVAALQENGKGVSKDMAEVADINYANQPMTKQPMTKQSMTKQEAEEVIKALPEDIRELAQRWDEVIRKIEEPIRGFVRRAKVRPGEGSAIILGYDSEMDYGFMNREMDITALKNAILSVINKDVDVKCEYEKGHDGAKRGEASNNNMPDISKLVNFEVEYED